MQRLARDWRREGVEIGCVPTMGCLHAGHLSLIERARREAGPGGRLVVSVYVNPTQFGPREDFSTYPRDLKRDARLCREAGVDVLFAPTDEQMYPGAFEEKYSTYVIEEELSRGMEGASRPTHFRGVTTIVAKLFNIIQPHLAVFGAKDYQQAAIIERMAKNLNFPVRVLVAPTLREEDGLAMSSRNKYLEGELRGEAVVLWRSIEKVRAAVRSASRPVPAGRLKTMVQRLVRSQAHARLDYVEFFEPESLSPLAKVGRGAHIALAVFVGETRLIDNARL